MNEQDREMYRQRREETLEHIAGNARDCYVHAVASFYPVGADDGPGDSSNPQELGEWQRHWSAVHTAMIATAPELDALPSLEDAGWAWIDRGVAD